MPKVPRCWPVVSLLLVIAPAALAGAPPAPHAQPESRKRIRIGLLVADIKRTPNSERKFFGGVLAPAEAGAMRRCLEQQARKGDARIIAQMDLVTVNGEAVEGFVGGEQPEMDRAKPTAEEAETDTEPAGTRFHCYPIIQQDGKIHLEVEPDVSTPSYAAGVVISGATVLGGRASQRFHTTVDLRSGETFLVGGQLSHLIGTKQVPMPLLGKLPVLGSLFQYKAESEEEHETVFLITATVCPDEDKPN
jgi:Flp pilus assembly secretin CpaC